MDNYQLGYYLSGVITLGIIYATFIEPFANIIKLSGQKSILRICGLVIIAVAITILFLELCKSANNFLYIILLSSLLFFAGLVTIGLSFLVEKYLNRPYTNSDLDGLSASVLIEMLKKSNFVFNNRLFKIMDELVNIGLPAVDPLYEAVLNGNSCVAWHGSKVLLGIFIEGKLSKEEADQYLQRTLLGLDHKSIQVRCAMVRILGIIDDPYVITRLSELLSDPNKNVRDVVKEEIRRINESRDSDGDL